MEPVELPPDANPLTSQTLFTVLSRAVSPQQQQIQTGAQQLQNWETHPGYFCMLQDVFMDKSLPIEIRYLAIIQLKNGIDKYWRKHAANSLSKEDKNRIRPRLLESGVNEADQRLALQNALVISKVVRLEYPHDWPDVISSIISLVHRCSQEPNINPLYLPRTLLILLHIIKDLSKVRTLKSRTHLQSIAPETFMVVCNIYFDKSRQWKLFLQQGGDDEGGAMDNIEQSLLALRVIRRLLIAAYQNPNRDKDVQEFWRLIAIDFAYYLDIVNREPVTLAEEVQHLVEKHLMQVSKLHLNMAKENAVAFALLPDSVGLVRAYWGLVSKFGETFGSKTAVTSGLRRSVNGKHDEDDDTPINEKLCLKGLLLLRASVKLVYYPLQTIRYRQPDEKEEQKEAQELVKSQLLTDDMVREIVEAVVTRFFVFCEADLREWEDEPEEWEKMEEWEGDGWEFAVRPCCEKLFLELVINRKELLIQPLLQVFQSVSTPQVDNVLFKDSVYTAIGLSAAVLYQHLDFDSFLENTLVVEVQKQQPGYNILRRRIAILIGQWVTVNISGSKRTIVYEIYQYLLNKTDPLNDRVVRITAAKQFKNSIEDWDVILEQYLPYVPGTLGNIMDLIGEVESTETKLALLNVVAVIIERLGHLITPYVQQIVSMLPPLWEQSGEEHLLKQSILTVFIKLIVAMKGESRQFHHMVLPLIRMSLEPGSETQVYLLEDALELLEAILKQTPRPASTELLSLAPCIYPVLESGTLNLKKALEILESYVLLAPKEMVEHQTHTMLSAFASILGTLKADANGIVTHLVEVILRAAGSLGDTEAVLPVYLEIVHTGFLRKLLDGLRGAYESHQATGPKQKISSIESLAETDYFSVLARMVLAKQGMLVSMIQLLDRRELAVDETMDWLLTEWFSHFGNMSHPTQKKLSCMALTSLLESNRPWILGRLQDLMTVWTDVITELADEDGNTDTLILTSKDRPVTDVFEVPEDSRRTELYISDMVCTINVKDFIRQHLQNAIQSCGGSEAFTGDWVVNVDQSVVSDFSKLGVL